MLFLRHTHTHAHVYSDVEFPVNLTRLFSLYKCIYLIRAQWPGGLWVAASHLHATEELDLGELYVCASIRIVVCNMIG